MTLHRSRILAAFAALAAVCLAPACSSEDDHGHGGDDHGAILPECKVITDACHEKDTGEGPAHDCHEFAHDPDTTAEQCMAKQTECLDACK